MFLEAGLLTRRSVRQFEKDREIPQSDIDDILKIAMYAPSARNTQPWEFVVVKDKKMRDKIAEVHPYAKFLKDASLAIVVCGDTNQETAPGPQSLRKICCWHATAAGWGLVGAAFIRMRSE